MTYHICNLHDDRVLCVHRDFEHYYIRSMYGIDGRMTMFETTDLEQAKSVLKDVRVSWAGSWVIVNTRGEVVT